MVLVARFALPLSAFRPTKVGLFCAIPLAQGRNSVFRPTPPVPPCVRGNMLALAVVVVVVVVVVVIVVRRTDGRKKGRKEGPNDGRKEDRIDGGMNGWMHERWLLFCFCDS